MGREGLMDDAGYRFDERPCPETTDDFDRCESCMYNGNCDTQREIEDSEAEEEQAEWNKLYYDTRF